MPTVTITCETEADHYDFSVFDLAGTPLFVCAQDTPFEEELAAGDYILAWRVFGAETTAYKIVFTGVSAPTKPIDRAIHKGEVAAASQKTFTV